MHGNRQFIARLIENCLVRRDDDQIRRDIKIFYRRHEKQDQNSVISNEMESLVPREVMYRGALVARDPDDDYSTSTSIPGLTNAERRALVEEHKAGFAGLPWGLKVVILLTSTAALIQNVFQISQIIKRLELLTLHRGWTQTSINTGGAGWAEEFGLNVNLDKPKLSQRDTLYYGFIQASPFLIGSVLGLVINEPLQYYTNSRRLALGFAGLISLASFIGSSYCRNTSQLLLCRLLLSIGVAAKASIAPILVAEAADGPRGKILIGAWQFSDTIGIFLGFCFHLATFPNWRATTAGPAIPTVVFLILVYLAPDSPHPAIQKGDYVQAFKSFRRLRHTDIQACRDLWRLRCQLQYETEMEQLRHTDDKDDDNDNEINPEEGEGDEEDNDSDGIGGSVDNDHDNDDEIDDDENEDNDDEADHDEDSGDDHEELPQWPRQELYQEARKRTSWRESMFQLFSLPYSRRACESAAIPMIAQIFTAVNVLAFYSSDIFRDENEGPISKKAAWLGFAFGACNVAFTIPAFFWVDKKGRRSLLIPSLIGVIITLLPLAFCFQIPTEHGSLRTGLILCFIVLFTFFYSIGAGTIPFTLAAEVFPLPTRSKGLSFEVFLNFFFLGLLILFVPELNYRFGHGNTDDGRTNLLCFFAGLSVLSLFLSFIFVRDTAEPRLVELTYIFDKPTYGPSGHVRFQLTQQLPWLLQRYLPWQWRQNSGAAKPHFVTWSEAREERAPDVEQASVGSASESSNAEDQDAGNGNFQAGDEWNEEHIDGNISSGMNGTTNNHEQSYENTPSMAQDTAIPFERDESTSTYEMGQIPR